MLSLPFPDFTFHPFQIEAIEWMTRRESETAPYVRGGILADEMGLGKTYMTIGLLINDPTPSKTLLIVPPVLQPQWTAALIKSAIPHRVLQSGAKFRDIPVSSARHCTVVLATYDRAVLYSTALQCESFDRIICDEGHVLRNGTQTRRFRQIVSIGASRRWILSGTPIQNKASEFGNLLLFLGMEKELALRTTLRVVADEVLLRRVVSDVRDILDGFPSKPPTHTIYPVVIPPGSEEMSVFQALVGRLEHAIESNMGMACVLELYLRIRQFIAHPAIYVDAMVRKFRSRYKRQSWEGTASKADAFRTYLATAPKEPTIVFGNFRSELDLAEMELRRAGYTVWSIRGGMTDAGRSAAVDESKSAVDAGTSVAIVVQIVAGGSGLNLQHCVRVCFLSSHWNPAIVDQAIARAYRMGQTKPVSVVHFLLAYDMEKNIDRRIANMHETKRMEAVKIHPKLVCDTTVDSQDIMATLDDAVVGDDG